MMVVFESILNLLVLIDSLEFLNAALSINEAAPVQDHDWAAWLGTTGGCLGEVAAMVCQG